MSALRILVIAGTLFATACSSATSPGDIAAALSMGSVVSSIRTFTSTTGGPTVTILGGIFTPYPCFDFAASVTTSGQVIDATVKATPMINVACIATTHTQDYTLTLTGVPAGSWTLRVFNQEGTKNPEQKYETSLTVAR